MSPPSGAAPPELHGLKFIEVVGSVPRWTRHSKKWVVDTDYLAFRKFGEFSRQQLAYQPARQGLDVELVRIGDYDRPQPVLSEFDLSELAEVTKWAIAHFSVGAGGKKMTILEAIDYVKASDCASRSPGYPLNQRFKTKAEALDDPEVVKELVSWYEKLGTADVESIFMSLSQKDEILKTTKVAAKKTRLFMAMPLFHHVAMVALFQDMQDRIFQSGATWCSAGRDFHKGGWDEMIRRIFKSSQFFRAFGADAEMYDMSICRVLFDAFYQVMIALAPAGVDPLVVEDLFMMALDGLCVTARGHVLHKHTGNPSGWFLTLLLNTVVMYLLLAMAWRRACPGTTRADFERYVVAWLCGDDSLVSVHVDYMDKMTPQSFIDVWAIFGIVCKELHVSENPEHLEYCGATSILRCDRWCRRPRVNKFLDALCFTQSRDPEYRLQRAVSIYHELWPVEEKEIVRLYCLYLCEKYRWLGKYLRKYLLTEAELCHLHTGVEGALRKHGAPKEMTKTKAQKEAKKAERKLVKAELQRKSPLLAVAHTAATEVHKVAKKKEGKGGGTFWSLLKGAAKVAAELAPAVAPFLVASNGHAPSVAAYSSAVASGGIKSSGAPGGVPLASPMGVRPNVGLYKQTSIRSPDGRVGGIRIIGMDYLGDLTVTGSDKQGAMLSDIDLNPFSLDWAGTRCQREASLYERYRVKRMACIVQSAQPATSVGQIIAFVDTDPDDTEVAEDKAAIQNASGHMGACVSQVWQMNVAAWCADKNTQDYWGDPNGSDNRLISPGRWRVLSATDMTSYEGMIIGSLYVAYEIEFFVPQLEMIGEGYYEYFQQSAGATTALPLGAGSKDAVFSIGNFKADYSSNPVGADGAKSTITSLPQGNYLVSWRATAAGSLSAVTFTTDEENYIQSGPTGTISATAANGMFALYVTSNTRGNYSAGWMAITSTGATVTSFDLRIVSRPAKTLSMLARRTLQDFEKQTVEQEKRIADQAVLLAQMQEQIQSLVAAMRRQTVSAWTTQPMHGFPPMAEVSEQLAACQNRGSQNSSTGVGVQTITTTAGF